MPKEIRNLLNIVLLALVAWIVFYAVFVFVKFIALYVVLPVVIVGGLGYLAWKVLK